MHDFLTDRKTPDASASTREFFELGFDRAILTEDERHGAGYWAS